MYRKFLLSFCFVLMFGMCGSAWGYSIDVNNWSFELDADGNQIYCHTGSMLAWKPLGTGYVGVDPYCLGNADYDPNSLTKVCTPEECYTDNHNGCHCWPALHGICYSYSQVATYVYQELTDDPNAVIVAGRKYILTVDEMSEIYRGTIEYMASQPTLICGVGEANHVDLATKTYTLKTWVGDLNEWEHTWEPNHTVEYVAILGSPHLGKVLGVKLGAPSAGGGVRAYDTLDRVRVEWFWATDAYNPNPANEAENVARNVTLRWSPGLWADQHIVYFSTSWDDVNTLNEDANQGIMDPNTWSVLNYDGNELDLATTYYWRIVEVNSTYIHQTGIPDPPWKGDIWSFTVAGYATNPNPADYATNVSYYGTTISWTPGTDSNSHDVYLGTDMSSVEDADSTDTTGIYKDNYDVNSYNPGDMQLGRKYYWRIDEVNENTGTLVKGKLWQFTVASFCIIDDFENYADSTAVKAVWKDYWTQSSPRTRAYTYLETTTIHDGAKAMRYNYLNNISPTYAEARATMTGLSAPTDWTTGGLQALTLYFHGDKTNQKTRMYVALTDSANHTGTVVLDDPNDITRGWKDYQEWNIELQRFNDANSVNLSSISKITLGFGNKASPTTATGNVYFDDIRLYPSRCVPLLAIAGGDYDYWDEDCTVDYSDVTEVVDDWLLSSIGNVTTSAPPDANRLRHYTMNDTAAKADVLDSSSYAKHGTIYDSVDAQGNPKAGKASTHTVAGKIGTALTFDGVDDFVNLPPLNVNTNTITFSAWATRDVMNMFSGVLYAAGPNVVAGFGLGADRETWEQNYEMWNMWDGNDWEFDTEFIMPGDDLWSFMAMTIAPNVTTLYMYDGAELRAARNFKTNPMKNFTGVPMRIADQLQYGERFWKGKIDDVRIYNYTLTPGQVLYLARLGVAGSQDIKLEVWRPNGNADGVVDLRDFAILAGNWLTEVLWP